MPSEPDAESVDTELPGSITAPQIALPDGYHYGVTRYADLILQHAFPLKLADLISNLEEYYIDYVTDIKTGGGSRARHTARHDDGLTSRGWSKHNVTIEKLVDGDPVYRVRNHEIDVFTMGDDGDYPGIANEMEWNNKDPFFHRDLNNFQALHREGVIAVGIIITRGPRAASQKSHLAPIQLQLPAEADPPRQSCLAASPAPSHHPYPHRLWRPPHVPARQAERTPHRRGHHPGHATPGHH